MPIRRIAALLVLGVAVSAAAIGQDALLDRAQRLDDAGRCDEAQAIYEKVLAAGSSLAALNNFGNHYLACNKPEEARRVFAQVLKADPAHANANLQMARLALARHAWPSALEYLNRARKADFEIEITRAEALAGAGRRDEARRIIDALAKNAKDPRESYALAMTCARAGFYPEAEAGFERVTAADPNDPDVLFNLGAAAARAGHYERAREVFSALLKLKPGDAQTTFELGRAEAALHNTKRAVYLLAQAKKAMPGRADVDLALARAAESAGYYGDAIAVWDDYLKLRPADDTARRDRALLKAFTRAGHEEGAKELADWVQAHPKDATGHYQLALVEGQTDRAAALKELSQAIALNPRFEEALYYRGWLLEQSGEYERSLEDAKAAVDLKPEDARALDLMGLDYLDLSRPADALPALKKAMKLAPEGSEIVFHMARCLRELGRRDEAQPLMARFQQLRREAPESARESAGIVEAATLGPDELARRVVAEYREAVANNPNDAVVRLHYAEALLNADRADEAEKAFRDLAGMEPPATVAEEAGKALLAQNRYGLAIDFLRMAAAHTESAKVDLALAELPVNGPEAAMKELKSADASGDAQAVRAMILDASGRGLEAARDMRDAARKGISRPRLAVEAAQYMIRAGDAKSALELAGDAIHSAPEDRLLQLTRVAALAAAGPNRDALGAAAAIERRWPEWDGGYVAEALLLQRTGRTVEAKQRMDIARALGASAALPNCSTAKGVWALLAGCEAKLPVNASPSR